MTPPSPAKTRSDSTIDSRLDSLQAELFFERLEDGLALRDGVAWLLAEHGITLSKMSLSRWAGKRRRAQAAESFAAALETLRDDRAQAAAALDRKTANPPDANAEFAQVNLLLANHALFTAQRDRHDDRIARATRTVTALQNSHTQKQRAETSLLAAERGQRHREFAAIRSVIEFENKIFHSKQGDEDMRDALQLYLESLAPEDAATVARAKDEAPTDEDVTPADASPANEEPSNPEPPQPDASAAARSALPSEAARTRSGAAEPVTEEEKLLLKTASFFEHAHAAGVFSDDRA